MPELFNSRYYRGQGPLFLANRDASGNPMGLEFIGDVSSASLTPNVERSETIENVTGVGGVGSSFMKRASYGLSIALRSIRKDHLAKMLHGVMTDKVGASVTDEAHIAYLDKFTALVNNKVTTVVVTGTGGTPTYVENTDYIIHADEGMIEFISGGTITDATAVEIDYTYAAQSHVSSSPNNTEKFLVFAGMNSADGDKQTRVEVYKVKLDPGVMDLITDDASDATISGTVELDSLRAAGDQFFSWKVEE
jgi:hypothetical protein